MNSLFLKGDSRYQYMSISLPNVLGHRLFKIYYHQMTRSKALKHVSLLKISYSCVNPMTLSSSYAIAMTDKVAHFHYSQMCIKTMTLKKVTCCRECREFRSAHEEHVLPE